MTFCQLASALLSGCLFGAAFLTPHTFSPMFLPAGCTPQRHDASCFYSSFWFISTTQNRNRFLLPGKSKNVFSTGLAVVILSLEMHGRWRGAETSVRLKATAWTDSLLLVNRWEVVSGQVHSAKSHRNCLILDSFF